MKKMHVVFSKYEIYEIFSLKKIEFDAQYN